MSYDDDYDDDDFYEDDRGYGRPRTDEERAKRHYARYGTTDLPPRGTGLKKKKSNPISAFFQKRQLKKQHPDLKDLMDEEKSWAEREIKARKKELLTASQNARKTIQKEIDHIFQEHKARMNRLDKKLMRSAMADDEPWDGELV